jgi:archaellum component FlaC
MIENMSLADSVQRYIDVTQGGIKELSTKFDNLDGWMQSESFKKDLRFKKVDERLDKIEHRLDGMDTRLDGIDTRLDGIDSRLESIDLNLAAILTLVRPQQ